MGDVPQCKSQLSHVRRWRKGSRDSPESVYQPKHKGDPSQIDLEQLHLFWNFGRSKPWSCAIEPVIKCFSGSSFIQAKKTITSLADIHIIILFLSPNHLISGSNQQRWSFQIVLPIFADDWCSIKSLNCSDTLKGCCKDAPPPIVLIPDTRETSPTLQTVLFADAFIGLVRRISKSPPVLRQPRALINFYVWETWNCCFCCVKWLF